MFFSGAHNRNRYTSVNEIVIFSIFSGIAILCNFVLMISWTPAALVFYQRFCCVNPTRNKDQPPLPNTEESLPNAAVVALASTGRLNCPSHLSTCNEPCCDNISCNCNDLSSTSNILNHSNNENPPLCCFKQLLFNCDISTYCCCCRHSCCHSWLTGRRKRYGVVSKEIIILFMYMYFGYF